MPRRATRDVFRPLTRTVPRVGFSISVISFMGAWNIYLWSLLVLDSPEKRTLAAGIKANFGTMTKPLHVGHSGRSGLMAVLIAERGFEANSQAMEHHQGFFNVFNGEGTFDATPLLSAWTLPLTIELPSIGIKQFPCCGSTHHAIAAMLDLRTNDGVTAENVDTITIHVHQRRFRHTNTAFPQSVLQAKFSQQYAVARALLDGAVRLKDFEDAAFFQPEIVRLLEKVTVVPFGEPGAPEGGTWDAEVSVKLADGSTRTKSRDELYAKYADCASKVIPAADAEASFEALMDLEKMTDFTELTAFLSGK